jgi:hypothetical protein
LRSDLVVDTNIYNCEWVEFANSQRKNGTEVGDRRLRFKSSRRGHFEPDIGL